MEECAGELLGARGGIYIYSQLATSSVLSFVFWLELGAPFLSPPFALSAGPSSAASTPMPKSTGRKPARLAMLGSAPTSRS